MRKPGMPDASKTRALMTGIGQDNRNMTIQGDMRTMRVCATTPEKQKRVAPAPIKGCGDGQSSSPIPLLYQGTIR